MRQTVRTTPQFYGRISSNCIRKSNTFQEPSVQNPPDYKSREINRTPNAWQWSVEEALGNKIQIHLYRMIQVCNLKYRIRVVHINFQNNEQPKRWPWGSGVEIKVNLLIIPAWTVWTHFQMQTLYNIFLFGPDEWDISIWLTFETGLLFAILLSLILQ